MKAKRILAAFLAAAICLSAMSVTAFAAKAKEFETAHEAVANMHAGINIANSFDCIDWEADPYSWSGENPGWAVWHKKGSEPKVYETGWGNPEVNDKYIKAIKSAGFDSVRLPVTWGVHCDKSGNIRADWLDRIQEVVDMILAEDMYCIINMHHESGNANSWIEATKENYGKNSKRFSKIWENIAKRFKDYDERLIFEGFNEMVAAEDNGEFLYGGIPDGKDYGNWYNKYMQLFVDTVRKTGGNNKYRNLLINIYTANLGYEDDLRWWAEDHGVTDRKRSIVDSFVLPNDSAKNHLIIGFHYYSPLNFCGSGTDPWIRYSWGTAAEKKETDEFIMRAAELGEKWNAPVVMGEFGAEYKNNSEEVVKWITYTVKKAREYGIPCFWWDDHNIVAVGKTLAVGYGNLEPEDNPHIGLFNRLEGKPVWTEAIDAIILNSYQGNLPATELTGEKKGNSVTLKWNKVSGANGYIIFELDGKTGKYKRIDYINGTKKTIKGLSKGTHKYKVVPTAKYEGKLKSGSASNVLTITV